MHDWIEELIPWMVTCFALTQFLILTIGLYQEGRIAECKAAAAIVGTIDFHMLRFLWHDQFGLRGGGIWAH